MGFVRNQAVDPKQFALVQKANMEKLKVRIEEFDYIAFIDKIQSTPKNILISSILQILRSVACCISMTLCLIYCLKNLFKPNDF